MKIAIDARTYFLRSGSGRYTRGVVDSLLARYPDDHLTLFLSNHKRPEDFPLRRARMDLVISAAELNNREAEMVTLPAEVNACGADVVLFPFFITPSSLNMPAVTVILDLTVVREPEHHLPQTVEYIRFWLRDSLRHAARIVAISDHVRADIYTFISHEEPEVDADKVIRIYPGLDRMFRPGKPSAKEDAFLAHHRLARDGYILYVGSIEARKNVDGLLRAWDRAYERIGLPLVLAGLERWGTGRYREALAQVAHPDRVVRLGYVADSDLPAFYRGARALAYPSLSEGFGFPVAEAYACATPVVTSDVSSLAEIGDAAIRVSPGDTEALAEALVSLTVDDELRADLIARGLRRAADFTWERCATALRRTMDEVCVSHSPAKNSAE